MLQVLVLQVGGWDCAAQTTRFTLLLWRRGGVMAWESRSVSLSVSWSVSLSEAVKGGRPSEGEQGRKGLEIDWGRKEGAAERPSESSVRGGATRPWSQCQA